MYEFLLKTPLKKVWQKIGLKKRAGVIFPLFLIFSKESLGIGEILDLKLVIDWCKITGNTILQILPLNDAGFNFHPYNPQSSFALDPVYLSLKSLIAIERKNLEKEFEDLTRKFPLDAQRPLKTKFVNWQIKREKLKKLWQVFLRRAKFPLGFQKFVKKNSYWLKDYCLYRVLKNFFQEKSWEEWPEPFKNREIKLLEKFEKDHYKEIEFQEWLQWQLFEQLSKVKDYTEKKKIFLKGDLPFLVARDSADVWSNSQYFKLNLASGAPPDLFSPKGQRWGMPPYNWEEIFKDDFLYFRERLKYAQNFYDLFRIDHLVGLFRIWSIPIETPLEKQGMVGFFDPPEESLWEKRGRKILKLIIKSTKMLPCAEDLGTVPIFSAKVLRDFGIPGLDIQRWKKNWQNFEFLSPKDYRKISVATLSTHDLSNFSTWWKKEAGGISKELFEIKCQEIGINFEKVKKKIFYSKGDWLFWKNSIAEEKLTAILNKPGWEIKDLIKIFWETYKEKEKFLRLFFKNYLPPKELIGRNLKFINSTASILSILLILEWLFLGDTLKGRPSRYRINVPGKISKKNFSLKLPISLEELLNLPINKEIRKILEKTGRI